VQGGGGEVENRAGALDEQRGDEKTYPPEAGRGRGLYKHDARKKRTGGTSPEIGKYARDLCLYHL